MQFYTTPPTQRRRAHRPGGRACAGWLALLLTFGAQASVSAAVWMEDFDSDPGARGWRVAGDPAHFVWNQPTGQLEVTWDSSRSNSFFYRPLGTVLTKADDFAVAFDLELRDIAIGTTPGKPYTFELALGLVQLKRATGKNFFRGAGVNAALGPRNLVEFDYFPDSGFGATVAPTVVSSNNVIRFSDNHPLELLPGERYRVEMRYTAGNQLLRISMTRDGAPFGLPPENTLRDLSLAGLADFRVDAFAICSYSDAMQNPPQFAGSLLAHGLVDNVALTLPEPPLGAVTGWRVNERWQVELAARAPWQYSLEASADLAAWIVLTSHSATTNGPIILMDARPTSPSNQFYRVRAERP